ncbi:cyclic pyranopterin monophosphate synthase MoaC [Lachnospiraceae bacterium 62-35]
MELSHFDSKGNAHMVDIGKKEDTDRTAKAIGSIFMSRECLDMVKEGSVKKGDVLGTARIAGIMGAKETSRLIPLCHPIPLTRLSIDFHIFQERNEIQAICTACTTGKTGVEMEALTGVSTALLTIYDMCKAIDKTMEIGRIFLQKKSGGKSGEFVNPHSTSY